MPQGAWAQELWVDDGETVTISEDASYDGIEVHSDGFLIINEGVTLTVTSNLNIHVHPAGLGFGTVINYGTIKGEDPIHMYGGVLANHGHIDVYAMGNGTFYNTGTLGDNFHLTPTEECNHAYYDELGPVDATCTHGAGTQFKCNTCYYIGINETGEPKPHVNHDHNGLMVCSMCGQLTFDAPTGDGTVESPYQIANAGHLFWFADKVNNDYDNFKDANAVLTADIVVNDGTFAADGTFTATGATEPSTPIEWLIIARFEKYRGIFDGQGHTISGLYANYECSGLVGMSAGECKIKNVGVINSYFAGIDNVGGICGYAGNNTEISNCYSSNVICKGPYVGGILGWAANNDVSIVNCYSTASLIGVSYEDQVGGIAGASGSTTNCYTSYGNVNGWSESEINCEANVSLERFASGEIAYKLNGSIDGEGNWTAGATNGTQKWYQKLGENGDSYPVLAAAEGKTVYAGYENCASVELSYSNANTLYATKEEAPHSWNDGICDICGGYQQPEGEGTEQSPYLIASKGNILWFNNSNSLANAQVKLVADVAITEAISVGSGKELTMNLDGHVLTGGEGIDIFDITGGTLNLRDAESNAGKLTKSNHGVMITDGGTFNMYGGSITECTSQGSAGAAVNVNDGTFNMFGGAITDNQNAVTTSTCYYRGVVYVHPINGYFNMQGGSITGNSGDTYGTGVYCVAEADGSEPTDHDGCLAAGTLVTMADGSKKAIEAVAIGESVLTMNHDTGEMTAEPVFFVHKTEMGGAFTLHFSNGTNVTAVKDHSFFEKADNRYVTLNPQNASSYVGRSFYCAETNAWVELTAVTPVEGTVGTYALLVAHTLNHLADGMLSANEPTFPVYNAFEFGDNLTIDPAKKAADIALYGTLDYEAVKDVVSREFFDALNGQYAPVLFGKGMASMENLLRMAASYLTPNNAKQSARTRAGEANTYHVTLSGKVIISGNQKTDDNSPSNLAVSEGMLSIGTLEAGSMIGIDLCISNKESEESTNKVTDRVYGIIASDAVEGDVQYFTPDNTLAGITYNAGKLEIHQHTFTNKTLTAEPVENGLYAYACDVDGCGGHTDDHIVKNGEGENTTIIELTADGEGNFSAASVNVADGQTFQTPVAFTVPSDQVKVARTFTASKPATVMLPFSIDASLVQGATFSEFGGVSYDAEKAQWVATMTSVSTTLLAYKPYIVMLDENNTTGKVTFGNTSANVATFVVTPDASTMQTADANGWTFKAVNAAKTWGTDDPEIGKAYGFAGTDKEYDGYSVAKGEFVKIAAGASAKPGRCYLVKEGALPGVSNAPNRAAEELPATIKVRFINGDTLGIGTLNTETGDMTLEGWFDLNGNKIEQPSKGGVYINNNKKVMVK